MERVASKIKFLDLLLPLLLILFGRSSNSSHALMLQQHPNHHHPYRRSGINRPSSFYENSLLFSRMVLNESKNNENNDDDYEAEAERWKTQAETLREQIRKMEQDLPKSIRRPSSMNIVTTAAAPPRRKSLLDNQRVLVVGANGRLGSMVCRHLLREHPELKEVIACVHVVSENSDTSRGYGRLSYEVGAEDGIGSIGPAWSSLQDDNERRASFQFDVNTMMEYNLQKLRIVECELLDPIQCESIVEDSQADVVIWCATDFNGNRPRAISSGGFNVALLFRAVADPTKGRVEVEGFRNMLGAIKTTRQDKMRRNRTLLGTDNIGFATTTTTSAATATKPVDVILVSTDPDAFEDFETPFGTFLDQKRQAEEMIPNDFPSLSYTTIQFARYEDNFVGENLDLNIAMGDNNNKAESPSIRKGTRRINRRDAAKAVAEVLLYPEFQAKKVQVWTDELRS